MPALQKAKAAGVIQAAHLFETIWQLGVEELSAISH
jgi:hypothetical protein